MLFLRRYTLKRTVVHAEGKKKTADLEKGSNLIVETNEAELGERGTSSVAEGTVVGDGDDSIEQQSGSSPGNQ